MKEIKKTPRQESQAGSEGSFTALNRRVGQAVGSHVRFQDRGVTHGNTQRHGFSLQPGQLPRHHVGLRSQPDNQGTISLAQLPEGTSSLGLRGGPGFWESLRTKELIPAKGLCISSGITAYRGSRCALPESLRVAATSRALMGRALLNDPQGRAGRGQCREGAAGRALEASPACQPPLHHLWSQQPVAKRPVAKL